MAASCERCPPPEARVSHRSPPQRPHRSAGHQAAGSPSLRGSVTASERALGRAGPPSTSSMACSCPSQRVERRHLGHRVAEAPRAPRGSRPRGAVRGGPRPAGRSARPARRTSAGADTAVAQVEPAVDEGRHQLGVDLRLRVAAGRPGHDPRRGHAVTEQHPGEQRVERPLAGRQGVRVLRVEAEVAPAVLVEDPRVRVERRPTRTSRTATG